MASTLIPKQKLDSEIDIKSLVSAYTKTVAGRLMADALRTFIRIEGFDHLKTLLNATVTAIPAVSPAKLNASGVTSMQTPKVGVEVVAVPSQWDGIPFPTLTYQWKAAGSNITGATASAYTPVTGDIGKALSCLITATNTGGSATETVTAANNVVAAS